MLGTAPLQIGYKYKKTQNTAGNVMIAEAAGIQWESLERASLRVGEVGMGGNGREKPPKSRGDGAEVDW